MSRGVPIFRPANGSPTTPMTVNGRPSTVMANPTMAGLPLKRRYQRRELMTQTRFEPSFRSSSGHDQAAPDRGDAEKAEVVAGDELAFQPFGRTSGAYMEGVGRDRRQAGHRRVPGAIVEKVRVRRVAQPGSTCVLPAELHQPPGIGDAIERTQQQLRSPWLKIAVFAPMPSARGQDRHKM